MKKIVIYTRYSIWRCPNCDYVTEYDGSGNKRCPVCGAGMMEE